MAEKDDGLTPTARAYLAALVELLKSRPTGEVVLHVCEGGIQNMRITTSVKPEGLRRDE